MGKLQAKPWLKRQQEGSYAFNYWLSFVFLTSAIVPDTANSVNFSTSIASQYLIDFSSGLDCFRLDKNLYAFNFQKVNLVTIWNAVGIYTPRNFVAVFETKGCNIVDAIFHDIGAKLASTANSCLEEEFKRKEMDRVFGQSLLHFLFLIDSSPAVNYENYHK